jgi:hypothetical protein
MARVRGYPSQQRSKTVAQGGAQGQGGVLMAPRAPALEGESEQSKRRGRAVAMFDDWVVQLADEELEGLELPRKRWT